MTQMIDVAILDDHPAVRAGLEAILAPEPDLRPVGFASREDELWPVLTRTRPAIVVLGVHHPERDGLSLCLHIKRQREPPSVVLYSAYTPTAQVVAAAVAGADAIVNKSSPFGTLLEAIRAVAPPSRSAPVVSPRMRAEAAARLDPSDHAILAMRLAGSPPPEIATTLGVPESAVADRIAAILERLGPASSVA
jgi:DNA-binding NarL/FixJ family response regulator